MTAARRTLLGTKSGFAERTRVYLTADAIEVDEIEGYTGVRTRVLLDEVRVITIDRRRSSTLLAWLGFSALLLFGLLFASMIQDGVGWALTVAFLVSSPLLGSLLIHGVFGADHLTVFGKRSNASMSFIFQKAKARRTFEMLREKVTLAQDEARARFAAEAGRPQDFGGQTG